MIFIVGQAFLNLGLCKVREAGRDNAVHGLPVLEEADDVMNSNAGAFDERGAAANTGFSTNIAIDFSGRAH